VPFKHGVRINIIFNKPVYKAAPKSYYGTVKWCKETSTEDGQDHFGNYGIGIQYL
jgi:hypothetical protein